MIKVLDKTQEARVKYGLVQITDLLGASGPHLQHGDNNLYQ